MWTVQIVFQGELSGGSSDAQKRLGREKYKTNIEHKEDFRTSIDIEVDLLAARFKLERQQVR